MSLSSIVAANSNSSCHRAWISYVGLSLGLLLIMAARLSSRTSWGHLVLSGIVALCLPWCFPVYLLWITLHFFQELVPGLLVPHVNDKDMGEALFGFQRSASLVFVAQPAVACHAFDGFLLFFFIRVGPPHAEI